MSLPLELLIYIALFALALVVLDWYLGENDNEKRKLRAEHEHQHQRQRCARTPRRA